MDGPSRKTLRLTFRATEGEVTLQSVERVNMICPPALGEKPEVATHGGHWLELQDGEGKVLFHRILHAPLGDSVEVHSPDGKIERVFGPPTDTIFEALVPDRSDAEAVVVMGEPPRRNRGERMLERAARSTELARFAIPKAGGVQ